MKVTIIIDIQDYLNLITRNGLRECGFRPMHEIESLQMQCKQDEIIHIEKIDGKDFAAVYPINEWKQSEIRRSKLKEEQALAIKQHGEKLELRKNIEMFKLDAIAQVVKQTGGKFQPSQAETMVQFSIMLGQLDPFTSLMKKYNLTKEQICNQN